MSSDAFTKVALFVIAVALSILALKPTDMSSVSYAARTFQYEIEVLDGTLNSETIKANKDLLNLRESEGWEVVATVGTIVILRR